MNHQEAFEELKALILDEDRRQIENSDRLIKEELLIKIQELEDELNDPDKFAGIIEDSKKEIIDVLGPAMGRMIRKYIQSEVAKINEKIGRSTNNLTSISFWKQKIFGVKKEGTILNMNQPEILEVLMIEKDSGLLLGAYQKKKTVDGDMVAGMLTAIKAFMEDTYAESKEKEVGMIDYGDFKIIIQSLGTYYYAVVIKGKSTATFEQFLLVEIEDFADKFSKRTYGGNEENPFNNPLTHHFEKTCEKLAKKLF